jgi:2-dehydro-3-deoxyphosphogluconate aldolase/(4S)-4-hydroxy-2-oxoglutarate aldolase
MLKALTGPFPESMFRPTHGIKGETAGEFLARPNVACFGGSWLTRGRSTTSLFRPALMGREAREDQRWIR